MKKLLGILMITGLMAACNSSNDSVEEKGEQAADTTEIRPTDPSSLNDAATHSQVIPQDSTDTVADSVTNNPK